ncbi:unnamed protein product [Allacma fusca]|uniref:Tudor domain-containing protein n=2 Tax=Allacma fusca TaxID=39272 RepID=A0A8J2JKQ5_9HEXA|nr:unnamed protein product [Allacma fusca]
MHLLPGIFWTLIYMDNEIDIPPYVDKEPKVMKRFRFVNVVSPSEFYLQNCYDEEVPQWYSDMQSFYKDSHKRAHFRIRTKELCKNRCYVWYDASNNTWNRVRVVNYTQSIGPFTEARLWLLDQGKFVVGDSIDMMELSKDFIFGALAFRGFLNHIKPLPEDNFWSENVVRAFKSLCTPDKLFVGVAITKDIADHGIQEMSLDRDTHGMILAEYAQKQNRGTLQAAMAKAGLVIPAGFAAGRHDLAYMLRGEPSYSRWNMERELNVKVHVDIIQERTEIASSQHYLSLDEKNQRHLVRGIQVKVGFIRITRVISPDNFYIQMEDKVDELLKMERDLGDIIQNFAALQPDVVFAGSICAARTFGDSSNRSLWSRVAIISVDIKKDKADAIYIDYGYERYVELSTLRDLPPYFKEIPPFCQRVHLDFSTIENLCMPSNITWDDDGCWKRYIESWNTEGAIYYAWQLRPRGDHSVIQLEEFHQTLNFDKTSMIWYAGRLIKRRKYLPLKRLRDHPLLKQFFCSLGVNMVYECENADFPVITEPAWSLLKDIGQVVSIYD